MLEIIDDINKYVLFENFFFVSFDVVNVFPNIDNKSGLLSGNEALTDSNFDVDSRHCFVDTLEMCLTCRNSKFYHQNSLQTDVQHRVLICLVPMLTLPWTSMTLLRISSILCLVFGKDLEMIFLYYGNMVPLPSLRFLIIEYYGCNTYIKINFTMEIVGDTDLKFLDLKLKINESMICIS